MEGSGSVTVDPPTVPVTENNVTDLYGQSFLLKYPDVTVNMFDVDYWSEKGQTNGLDKLGFASTRRMPSGQCTHEVVMLSGELRDEMVATAAHEYTHLWISENRAEGRTIDTDTVEAICELTAYKLMQKKNLPAMQKKILENPYTHGKIKTLIEIEQQSDTDYVLDWVKRGKTTTLEEATGFSARTTLPATSFSYAPPVLPQGLQFKGLITIGKDRQAVINGAREIGYRELKLDTLNHMAEARALYARLGFHECPPYYHNPIDGAVYMARSLEAR